MLTLRQENIALLSSRVSHIEGIGFDQQSGDVAFILY